MSELRTQEYEKPLNENASFNTQITYSFINNNLFYPLVPKPYYDYYNRFIRQYFYWYDGFNPFFHNAKSGIFSTRLPKVIVDKLASLIIGGKLMYDPLDKLSDYEIEFENVKCNALQFIEKWDDLVGYTSKRENTEKYALVGGDSVIKLNSDGDDLYPVVFRKDNYFLDVDFKGEITSFTGVVYTHTKTNKNNPQQGESEDWYYLLEERRYDKEGNPQYRLYVKAGFGNMTTNKSIDFSKIQDVPYNKLPKTFVKDLNNMYPGVKLDNWMDLPLETIGIFMFKASEGISNMPQLPFGESIFSALMAYFQGYDYTYSNFITDQYIGRGKVLIPKPMQMPNGDSGSAYSGLDELRYTLVDYLDPNSQKPISIQMDLRVEEWMKSRNNVLQMIAMHLGISSRTLATFVDEGVEKPTAREISVDDATSTFVQNHRTLNKATDNKLLNEVLAFYDFPDKVKVRFSRVGLNNMNDVVQQITVLKQNGLIDLKTSLEKIYVDKNEREINEMMENIKEEQERQIANVASDNSQNKPFVEEKDGTSDEDYEQKNNRDIAHVEKRVD